MGGEDVAPVILSTERDGRHLVIDGNHRLLAARQLGLKTLNCIVTDLTFAASADFRQAEGLLKRFDQQTGFRFNTSGFTRQFFAYRASRYYSDHFHRHTWRRHLLTRYRWARALAAVLRWGRRLATSVARGLGVVPRA